MAILRRYGRRLVVVASGTALATAMVAAPAAAATAGEVRLAGGATAVANSYIVVLKESAVSPGAGAARTAAVAARAGSLTSQYGGTVNRVFGAAVTGFEATLSTQAARRLAANSTVAYVEQNHTVSIAGTQTNPPSWGLDRIDQRYRPLDNSYTYPTTAGNVTAYIIDTGIRTTHNDFGGRARAGYDAFGGTSADCNGHGTHVAGTVGGSTYGVAKGVRLVAVRVLDCSGSGTTAGVIAGVNWVTGNAVKPAVANMSLGGPASTTLDRAVSTSIASGITYAVAAGNSTANACNSSPARVGSALTVGATTSTDARAYYSNYGTCLDIFAPGSSITAPWYNSNSATRTISGTSMAAPHVAGAAALVLGRFPAYPPSQVGSYLTTNATAGVVTSPGGGSPNRLLFVVN